MKRLVTCFALAAALTGTARADTVVKIGFAGPLTGPIAHVGKDEQFGAQLALDDVNAKGLTLNGQKVKFELMPEDDQADPRVATTVAQRLADAGVKGVVGHVTSGAAIPASRIYEQAGIPAITPSSTTPKLTQQGFRSIYRVIANDLQQGAAMARFATGVLKAQPRGDEGELRQPVVGAQPPGLVEPARRLAAHAAAGQWRASTSSWRGRRLASLAMVARSRASQSRASMPR